MATTAQERTEAIADLRRTLKRGATVYTVLRHRSASGMMRVLDLYIFRRNEPVRLTWSVAKALGWTYDRKRDGLKVTGCGMDMGFHTVNVLSYALHGHKNRDDGKPAHEARDGHRSGYTLKQRWL